MKALPKRLLALCLSLVILGTLILQAAPAARAVDYATALPQLHYGEYGTLSMIYDQGSCYSMQGMALDKEYTYCAKIGSNDAIAMIVRTDKSTGEKANMVNASTGTYYFTNLGHANALDIVSINGSDQMFVTAGATLVRLTMSGTTLTTAGTYTASYNGSTASMTAVQVMAASSTEVKVIVKTGRNIYTGTLDPTASSGDIALTKLCTLDVSSARLKGSIINYSAFTQQGFDYHDGKLFLPLSGNASAETINQSVVLVYDLQSAGGTVLNDPTLSFRVISGTYAGLFEIEDVAICQQTGRLYFSTNRRKTSSDTNYDSCSYFLDYSYNAAMDAVAPSDYRWETVNNELVTVTDGGNTYNNPTMFYGSMTDGVMQSGIFNLSRSVMLLHDAPWVIEWKSSGAFGNGGMMLAAGRNSRIVDAPFLFRYKESGVIGFGHYDGSSHYIYGLSLSDYGIDGTAEHVYRMTNKIASDGSNMVWLSVDGTELGPLNNKYLAYYDQNTTSDWLNGRDMTFSYIGSYNHPMTDVKLDYLQIWANGEPEPPKNYLWETVSDDFTSITGDGLTANKPYMYHGNITDGVYANAAFRLTNSVKLLHDRPWSVEWDCAGSVSGGSFLLAGADGKAPKNSTFLYRYGDNGLLSIGYHDGSQYNHYGLYLSDYGIDTTVFHTYRLSNRIFEDGTNMVYAYVDDVELGPMNHYYPAMTDSETTDDWVNGQDLVLAYSGPRSGTLKGSLSRLQVWEEGKDCTVTFLHEDGTVLKTETLPCGAIPTPPADPSKEQTATHIYTFTGWDQEITAVTGDVTYTAVFGNELRTYPVTFLNDDGTVIAVQDAAYGSYPTEPETPTKAGDAQYSYTFAGWDSELTQVESEQTYTATYTQTVNSYTVTFQNYDGTLLEEQTVAYGAIPTPPADPVRESTAQYSYRFAGWHKNLTAVTKDTTYIATYIGSVNSYTVTFLDEDGTVLSEQTVAYGETPTVPEEPTKASDALCCYNFNAWTPAVTAVTGDAAYTATYFATAHSFVDGACGFCGMADPNSVVAPTLTLKYPTLSFEDEILLNVYFEASDLEDVADMGLITYSSEVTEWNVDNAEEVISGYGYSESAALYYATTNGIPAKCLGDTLWFAVYAKLSDGSYIYTKLVSYSPRTYAYTQLNYANEKTKALVVAMLNYGAAAQTFFSYNTDALVNDALTADHLSLIESYRADMMDAVPAVTSGKEGTFANTGGYAKRYPTISFEGAFCINYYYTPSYAPADGITMYYWNQADFNAADVLTAENATGAIKMAGEGTGEYLAIVEGIAAKDLDKGIYVSFCYSDGTNSYASGVLAYSIGSYCTTQAGYATALQPFAQATAVYGYYAKQLFYEAAQ